MRAADARACDERWALLVTVPALVLSLPIYVGFTAVFLAVRETFALTVEFAETCGLLPDHTHDDEQEAA